MNNFLRTFAVPLAAAWVLASPALADTKTQTVDYTYDTKGRLTKKVIEPDSPNDCLQMTYTYDDKGSKNSTAANACAGASGYATMSATSTRTSTVTYSTEEGHFPETKTNALGQSQSASYDTRTGVLKQVIDANGVQTQWDVDTYGRRTKETRPEGTYTTWTYKLCSDTGGGAPSPSCPVTIGPANVFWVVIEQGYKKGGGVNGPEKRRFYDNLDRVVREQTQGFDGSGTAPVLVKDTEYNNRGLVARQSKTYALSGGSPVWTTYTYDVLGRVTQESRPDSAATGGTATTTYVYNGLTTVATNSKGQTKTAIKNAQGQIAQVIDAKGSSIFYSYDAAGQLTQVNAAGSITTISYNQRGQKSAMVDPAMGAWEYRYNAFGELVSQRDSLNRETTLAYDKLGRMTQRVESDLTSNWSYDKKIDGTACGKGIGKVCEATAANGYKRVHTYDNYGRPTVTSTVLDNPAAPAVVTETYDQNRGFVATKTWPTGFTATYAFTPLGYLKTVTGTAPGGTATGTITYTVLAMNEQGQVTQYKTGNQVTTVRNFDAQSNRLQSIQATTTGQSVGNVLNQAYTWDELGNLTTRVDNAPGTGTQESFAYDSVNRLTQTTLLGGGVSPPEIVEAMYDDRDNITYKSDVGRYWYDADRPNRMTNVTLETAPGAQVALTGTRALSYAFDDSMTGAQTVNGITVGNGNLQYTVSQDTLNNRHSVRGESYTSFNMPSQVVYGNFINPTTSTADRTLTFVYGPEHQRIKQTVQLSGSGTSSYSAGTTWHLNGIDSLGLSFEKEIKASGMTENKHYLSAGGQVFALYVSRTGTLGTQTATTTSYLHQDHLGSVTAVTDNTGAVAERMAYDPWGKRRNTNGVADVLDSIVGAKTDRGYTMHEHLDEIGVIHMNARVYDPLIGRFMSADSMIPNPFDMKAFNRYSYVSNNPLRATDPTGHITEEEDGAGGGAGAGMGGGSGMKTQIMGATVVYDASAAEQQARQDAIENRIRELEDILATGAADPAQTTPGYANGDGNTTVSNTQASQGDQSGVGVGASAAPGAVNANSTAQDGLSKTDQLLPEWFVAEQLGPKTSFETTIVAGTLAGELAAIVHEGGVKVLGIGAALFGGALVGTGAVKLGEYLANGEQSLGTLGIEFYEWTHPGEAGPQVGPQVSPLTVTQPVVVPEYGPQP